MRGEQYGLLVGPQSVLCRHHYQSNDGDSLVGSQGHVVLTLLPSERSSSLPFRVHGIFRWANLYCVSGWVYFYALSVRQFRSCLLSLVPPFASLLLLQVSVLASQGASEHFEIGRALAPLRDEGVVIVGSGLSYHNFAGFR